MHISNKILSDITVYMKYAKFLPEKKRRETWVELVNRNKEMHLRKFPELADEIEENYKFVYNKQVLPSMRSLQFAGKAIEVGNQRLFNCAYLHIDSLESFAETMFLLLSGTGVGYSVQGKHVEKLPVVRKPLANSRRYVIGDSIEGWADAVKVLMKSYFKPDSLTVKPDYSGIREKGAELVTSGGKAPGPDPLRICLEAIRLVLDRVAAEERQLKDIEVHDIICLIADAVLAGGIRRAALISLFDLNSEAMLNSKGNFKVLHWDQLMEGPVNVAGEPVAELPRVHELGGKKYFDLSVSYVDPAYGPRTITASWVSEDHLLQLVQNNELPWFYFHPHRGRANNSAVILRHKITKTVFKKLWKIVQASGCGEPGIFLTNNASIGTNPCAEISLKPNCFCNLTEINGDSIFSQEEFNQLAKVASFIGTLQATYTDFHYLRPVWRKTTEKDALLGVSITGVGSGRLIDLDESEAASAAVAENIRVSALLKINPSVRITTVKPAGTTSLVLGTSSGIHDWHDEHYVRRIRIGKNEALYGYLKLFHPELVEDDITNSFGACISIPQKAPETTLLRNKETTLSLLERIKRYNKNWVASGHLSGDNTHNVSATVSVRDTEWDEVGEWMWINRDSYTGISVLPYDGGTYIQAPFETILPEQFEKLLLSLCEVDLSLIIENENNTNLVGELACSAGGCETK